MSDRVDKRIKDTRVPGEAQARERGWEVVQAAYREAGAPPRHGAGVARIVLAAAAFVTVVVVALTPPGPALARWIKHAIDLGDDGVPHARHALSRLPAAGRLLTAGPGGAAIVHADGSRRFLGPFREASWSPQGRFVVAVRGRQLVAVDPVGHVRWAITPPDRPTDPRWSPDGFRIAYRSGSALRVVAGDGTGDRALAPHARAGTLAWRPRRAHTLAWGDEHGRLVVADVDRGTIFRSALGGVRVPLGTRAFAWSADGLLVYALRARDLRVFAPLTGWVHRVALPAGRVGIDLAPAPVGRRVALLESDPSHRHSEIVLRPHASSRRGARRLFAARGRLTSVDWSPDSRWVLATWRDADQWVFVRPDGRPQITAVADVAAQLDPGARQRASFPRVEGWCCAP